MVEKPWGRNDIPMPFRPSAGQNIGEIWFESASLPNPPLLVKYIFTSERLSIQVHPNDEQAQSCGLAGGKSECWYVLDAEPDARLGIGLIRPVDETALRAAARDGSIEEMLDWKQVQPGSFFYIPAGTIHAIGAGITLLEVQQNNDVTYRLYDYGRPRPLHLDDALAVSMRKPYPYPGAIHMPDADGRLVDGTSAPFTIDMITLSSKSSMTLDHPGSWFIPLSGSGTINGDDWIGGECWYGTEDMSIYATDAMSAIVATVHSLPSCIN